MLAPFWMLLIPAQVVDSDEFGKELQQRAVCATVRIANRAERSEGSGVVVGRKDGAVYVLTAAHYLTRPGRVEVSTFTEESYPRPAKVYANAEVVARTRDTRDLALVRLTGDQLPAAQLRLCPLTRLPKKEPFEALSVGCGEARAPVCLIERGTMARLVRRGEGARASLFWETAAAQAPGRSGGPLLDRQGNVLGIASGANRGKGYYSHAREIHRWLESTDFAFLLPAEEKRTSD